MFPFSDADVRHSSFPVVNVAFIGLNVLVFKVVNETIDWRSSIWFTDAVGEPVPGLSVTDRAPVIGALLCLQILAFLPRLFLVSPQAKLKTAWRRQLTTQLDVAQVLEEAAVGEGGYGWGSTEEVVY